MANSIITFKEKGFWVNDSFLEIIYHYLIKVTSKKLGDEQIEQNWLEKLNEDISYFLMGFMPGAIGLDLDGHLKCKMNQDLLIDFFSKTKELLTQQGEFLSVNALNDIEREKKTDPIMWEKPIKVSTLLKLIDNIVLLLKEEWKLSIKHPNAVFRAES